MPRSSNTSRDARRSQVVGREQPHPFRRPNALHHAIQILIGQIRQVCLVPALFDACKRQLHAAHVRHDFEAVLAQLLAQVARRAVKQRIAAGQNHHALVGVLGHMAGHFLRIAIGRHSPSLRTRRPPPASEPNR